MAEKKTPVEEILSVTNLQKHFEKKGLFRAREIVRAVDGVSFTVEKGTTFVLAGESGSGKSTIARLILGGIEQDSGDIVFDGFKSGVGRQGLDKIRRECQMIHQDPYASIDPRMRVADIVAEPLEIHGSGDAEKRRELVSEALLDVKLDPAETADKHPHMLSGGQRQRVAIARAIVTKPKMIIADEPVSMLDVSVRVGILQLMRELQEKRGISFLYITHDLSTARYVGNMIAILYLGKIVESGPLEEVLARPMHPYTRALMESISEPSPDNLNSEKKIHINAPLDINPYEGCRFRPRCPYAVEKCSQEPPLEDVGKGRKVACFVRPD